MTHQKCACCGADKDNDYPFCEGCWEQFAPLSYKRAAKQGNVTYLLRRWAIGIAKRTRARQEVRNGH